MSKRKGPDTPIKAMREGRKVLIVLDIDGVVAGGGYIPPAKRTPETYAALPVGSRKLVGLIRAIIRANHPLIELVYLTKRPLALRETTWHWLTAHNIWAPTYHVNTQQEKLEVLEHRLPLLHHVTPQCILFYDDRWKEMAKHPIVKRSIHSLSQGITHRGGLKFKASFPLTVYWLLAGAFGIGQVWNLVHSATIPQVAVNPA